MSEKIISKYDDSKADQDLNMGAPLMNDENSKWELDVEPMFDRVYNELLGNVLVAGVWTKHPKKSKIMNELGASEFVNEISSRVSIHQQLSELDEKDIIEISSIAAEIFADKLEDNWDAWSVNPSTSSLSSIAQKLFDSLFIFLRIAKSGGMKKHREHVKNPYIRSSYPASSDASWGGEQ